MWPDADDIGYWPAAAPREETITAFIHAFRALGYEEYRSTASEQEFEKIAVYALDGQPTHAARQLVSGRWTSKLGPQEDIEHDFDALDGSIYGSAVAVLRRPFPPKVTDQR